MNRLSSEVNVVVLIGIVWCFFISLLIFYFSFKNSLIIHKEKGLMRRLYLITDTAKLYVQILAQNNLKSKYCYAMMWLLRALWLVVAHDLSENSYMDDVTRNLFSLFCSTWRAVLKMFVRLLRIKASEILEKSSTGATFKKEKRRLTGTKRALDYFRMLKLQEIFTTAAIVFHRYERLAVFAKCFRHYSALSKKRRWKTFRRNYIQLR